MNIKNELMQYNVSRETVGKLEKFAELLREWNQKMNLVSRNSLEVLWERHILDSAQLINYIPVTVRRLLDIGSGAGFPGIVLAIIMQEKMPDAEITLVESITKKTVYLKDVCERLNLSNVNIVNDRVENIDIKGVDVITARAVAALDVLCRYAAKFSSGSTESLFLKGQSYNDEIVSAQKNWDFKSQIFTNRYCNDGVILKISRLRKKK